MKIFISWSGEHAKEVALTMRRWIKDLIQESHPWVSERDIPAGGRGLALLFDALRESEYGIVCITRESQESAWVNFEAGAVAHKIHAARVTPVLINLPKAELQGPLTQFQYRRIEDREEMLSVAESIWECISNPHIDKEQLKRYFDMHWQDFNGEIERIRSRHPVQSPQPARTPDEKLDEILSLARENRRRVDRVENYMATSSAGFVPDYRPSGENESGLPTKKQISLAHQLLGVFQHLDSDDQVSVDVRSDGAIEIRVPSGCLSEEAASDLQNIAAENRTRVVVVSPEETLRFPKGKTTA
jgi:hypothetical protein